MSSEETGGNPITEGLGHAARHAAEVAAVLAMGAQAAIRVRERQLRTQTDAERGQLRVEHAAARLTWSEPHSSAPEAARVWAAAQPWADRDPAAAEATRRAEARLDDLVPDIMDRYRHQLAGGDEPAAAMNTATTGLGGAAAAAWAQASTERAAAAAGFATPDLPATRLDEHHQGVTIGGGHADEADTEAARAATLAAVAYPAPVTAALAGRATPPPAARPGPARRDLHRGRSR